MTTIYWNGQYEVVKRWCSRFSERVSIAVEESASPDSPERNCVVIGHDIDGELGADCVVAHVQKGKVVRQSTLFAMEKYIARYRPLLIFAD